MEYPRDSHRSPQKYLLTVSDLSSLDPTKIGFFKHYHELQLQFLSLCIQARKYFDGHRPHFIMKTNGEAKWILGSRIDATSYVEACDRIQVLAQSHTSCYLIAANVHVVMTGYWQPDYQQIINEAALVTPDGMPLVWTLRQLGIKQQSRVYGPDLMMAWCERAAEVGLSIYLYGGTESMLTKLESRLIQQFPSLLIAGSYAPPFRPLTAAEEKQDCDRIQASGASVVFVALGCPKQEQWMARQQGKLNAIMIGVGAAFSFHSGETQQSPRWMMRLGLEWLYRFSTEPRRLWRRYLINNPIFILLVSWQLLQYQCKRSREVP